MIAFWSIISAFAVSTFLGLIAGMILTRILFGSYKREIGKVGEQLELLEEESDAIAEELNQVEELTQRFAKGEGALPEAAAIALDNRIEALTVRRMKLNERIQETRSQMLDINLRHPWTMRLLRMVAFVANKELPTFGAGANNNVSA